jgi:hypothetical protein
MSCPAILVVTKTVSDGAADVVDVVYVNVYLDLWGVFRVG